MWVHKNTKDSFVGRGIGHLGKMGKKVFTACAETDNVKAICGVDIVEDFSNADFPIYPDFESVKEKVDVIIDFSSPLNFERLSSSTIVLPRKRLTKSSAF